jgi:hypothetical protein
VLGSRQQQGFDERARNASTRIASSSAAHFAVPEQLIFTNASEYARIAEKAGAVI